MIADGFVRDRAGISPREAHAAAFVQAGQRLHLESDDLALIDEVASLLGPARDAAEAAGSGFRAFVQSATTPGRFGRLRLQMPRPELLAPTDLLLAATSVDFPFELLESNGTRVVLAERGCKEPALVVDGGDCAIAMAPGWRKAVGLLLLQRLMRCREDALFFHAASVAVDGRGLLLVGPKGAGKSTLALALAARGHALLGDENACYVPASGELVPFLRPVGIKPGPRASSVEALLSARGRSPERDGMMRVPVEDLLPGNAAVAVPLAAVAFLTGFAEAPRLQRLDPARLDVGRLQPVASSFLNAPRTRRVFEMSRLLSSARVYDLAPGDVEATAALLETELREA